MYVFNSVLWCKTNFGENQRGNQKWTFQRHWQHWEHKTQYEDKTQKHKNTILFALSEAHDLLMLFVFVYVGCCPMWFPCQMMLISFNFISNKTGFISRSRTAFLTFETDQFLFLTIFYKHAHPNNQPHNNLHAMHKNTELLFWLTWRGYNSHCLHDRLLKVHSCQTIHNYITKLRKTKWKIKSNTGKKCKTGKSRASSANDWNLTLVYRRFPCLALLPCSILYILLEHLCPPWFLLGFVQC